MGRIDDLQAAAKRYAERAEAMRKDHGSLDAAYVIADRDSEVGGGLMAGALAYRLFVWLLPFALVVVGGIGVAADVSSESTSGAAKSLGLSGIASHSVADASRSSSRFYAIAIGIPVLVWASRGLLKALVVVHRLVWGDPRRTVPKPTLWDTARFVGFLIAYFGIRELARWVGLWTDSWALRMLTGLVGVCLWWVLVSMRLPHRDARWRDLVPGALLMAAGLELLADVGTYLISPRIETSQSTYGALGIAATLLFGLYLVSRLVVASAVVNASVREQRLGRRQTG
jgi:membrane protein